ncbi:hypothetical protein JCM25156A_20470 [Komagataeibacter kakiaceti JCM 25156]|uniref:hypothetical protein n=1 Tax=Komagataeibacter kakiaceti TaxID=943261 RepID=UPI0011DDFCD7|nr:hypothetical protein [Komagataeibacter kakiaceti]
MARQLWIDAQKDQALQIALARITALTAEVPLTDAGTTHASDPVSTSVCSAHNPFSHHKMAAAGEIFASAVLRAEAARDYDLRAARRLVWAWSRQCNELFHAMVRLGCKRHNILAEFSEGNE